MIRHIVLFTVPDPDQHDPVLTALRALEQIPGQHHLEVEANLRLDDYGNEIDFVVYGEFKDEAALRAYKAHPEYQHAVRIVRPLRELRLAADVRARPPIR